MVKHLNKRALVLGITVALASGSIGSLHAQQFGGGESPEASAEAVAGMQALSQQLPAMTSQVESAEDLAYNFVDRAVENGVLDCCTGWNEEAQVYVAIGIANYPVSNPAADQNFGQARALKSLEASLVAKREIIEYVRLELDFSSVMSMEETGLGSEFDEMRAQLEQEIAVAMSAYQSAVEELGAAEASHLQGVTMGELVKEGIAGFIQSRLNPDLDLDRMEADKRQRFEEAQNNLRGFQGQLDQLTAQAQELRGQVQQTQGLEVETYAAMALVGATMVGQFESWIDGNYQVAVVYTWSTRQEQEVRNILAGRSELGTPGRQALGEYLRSNDWSTAIGGRKFKDDRGQLHIVGIGAWPLRGNSSAQRRSAEGFARTLAQSQIALAFAGDVAAKTRAQAKMDEIETGGEVTTAFAESFSTELAETTQMTLQGVQSRFSRVLRHPISGQEMHVVVMTASANQTAAAQQMEEALFRGAGAVAGLQQFSRGTRAGMEERLERERSDTSAFQQGRSAGSAPSGAPAAPASAPATQQAAPAAPGQPSSVTGGGSDVDAFGW